MKLIVFGLSVSSSWGNGHAVLWRALIRSLGERGHHTVFFERDVPYYAENRDLVELPGGELVLYQGWRDIAARARREIAESDAAIVTSYCPDALAATDLVFSGPAMRVFYDLDSPVTLARLQAGERVEYIGPDGLGGFDLVLSYTGGSALTALQHRLGAVRVAPLYGSVDPQAYRPAPLPEEPRAALSYLGTYAKDRQAALSRLFLEPARRQAALKFVIGGAQYPPDFPWLPNIFFERHVMPPEHPRFYAGARWTLNITRAAMAACGWCPSGRLFEAAACAAPILSDAWPGLDRFFTPGQEIVTVRNTSDVLDALHAEEHELARIGSAARERALAEHTAARRAEELVALLDTARTSTAQPMRMEA